MEQLIEMAQELGEKIAVHERTIRLKQAQKQVSDDSQASQLVQDYQKQAQRLSELESQQKPIEVEDKRLLRELEEKISTHPTLTELTRKQVDFVEMMQKVKQAIDDQLKIKLG